MRRLTSKVHGTTRKILGLPFDPPSPVPYDLIEKENGVLEVKFAEGEAKQAELDAWYKEGVRGEIAETVSDWLRPVRIKARATGACSHLKARYDSRRAYRSLAYAKHLTFSSPYLIEQDSCAVEGWLEQDSGRTIPFNIISARKLTESLKEVESGETPSFNKAYSSYTAFAFTGNWVVVPDELSDEAIAAAIEGWYLDRFKLSRKNRDWTPRITVAISRDSD